jgi:hypothetical protein
MGVLDTLFRPRKVEPPKIDDLFKLHPASVDMERFGLAPTGKAGVCFKTIETKGFDKTKDEIVEILKNSAFEARYDVTKDEYGFTWVAIESHTSDDAIANVYMASQLLIDGGFGDHIVCAVFRFDKDGQPAYWIYNYRRANFYPFVPLQNKERDFQLEYRLRLRVSEELPVEIVDYWYPIWGVPF